MIAGRVTGAPWGCAVSGCRQPNSPTANALLCETHWGCVPADWKAVSMAPEDTARMWAIDKRIVEHVKQVERLIG